MIVRCYPYDRDLYPGEISRTDQSHYNFDEETEKECRYCYNENIQRIMDELALRPFANYHKAPFRAYSCYCCGAIWSLRA